MPWPMSAARWVARVYSIRVASNARSARPPSIGNAGSRLKPARNTFANITRSTNPPVATPTRSTGSQSPGRLQPAEEQQRDDDVHGGPGQRHPQLLNRLVRHSFESGQASDGKQRDVAGPDPVPPRRERVAILVEHDAGKQRQDESNALDHRTQTLALVPVDQRYPCDHHQEGGVHVDVNSRDPRQFP